MITLEQVSFGYGKQKVIEELSVVWEKGGIHGLVGLNGAGKTTLLNGIYGLQKLKGGSILWEGNTISKKDIAYLETQNYFYDNITGSEYLRLFMHKNPSFAPAEWNKLFHLPLDKLISTYSTGMKKKLAFMGVLCLDRPVYMLDEPYNGVDLETTQHFKLIMKALKESGKTLILTSHIFESLTSKEPAVADLLERYKNDLPALETQLHQLAKTYLEQGETEQAWCVLLQKV